MGNFIRVFDKEYVPILISKGFKLLHQNDYEAVFIYEPNKYDISKFDKTKVLMTNRLHF